MINEFFVSELEDVVVGDLWCQQDGYVKTIERIQGEENIWRVIADLQS